MADTTSTDEVKESLGQVMQGMVRSFSAELFSKTQEQLEEYWFFTYHKQHSVSWNIYEFHKMLALYAGFVRRWEEQHHGLCCVVERVRDQYLLPKIKQFEADLREAITREA